MNRIHVLTVLVLILTVTACKEEESGQRVYSHPSKNKTSPAPAPTAPAASDIHWHIPPGWKKESANDGVTAQMYSLGDAQLTITPLTGAAGGIEANVQRWRQQAGLEPFSEEELKTEIKALQTGAGPAKIVKVSNSPTASKQLFGAILPQQGTTWFVKMTGPYADLNDQRWQEFTRMLKAAHRGSH